MRRSYIIEYTILLIICFFAVRTCISEKQANTDLKSENTAISDSTHLYKEKYGQEHAAKEALLDTILHTGDSLPHIPDTFYSHPLPATMLLVQADTCRAGNKEIIHFRYGNRWISASGTVVMLKAPGSPAPDAGFMAGKMLLPQTAGCNNCHKNTSSNCLFGFTQ